MGRQQGWVAFILALAISAAVVLYTNGLRLGLDLRGGSQLTLQVLPAGAIKQVDREQLEAVKDVLDRRINGLGVAESTLQTVGNDQLVLQLPGEQDPSRAAKVLGTTALLEFRAQKPGTDKQMQGLLTLKRQAEAILASIRPTPGSAAPPASPLKAADLAKAMAPLGIEVSPTASEADQLDQLLIEVNRRILSLYGPPLLTGRDLTSAGRQQQSSGDSWEVTLGFDRAGGEKFAGLTQSIAGTGRVLGIVLDGRSISEATVGPQFKTAGITGGSASISGSKSFLAGAACYGSNAAVPISSAFIRLTRRKPRSSATPWGGCPMKSTARFTLPPISLMCRSCSSLTGCRIIARWSLVLRRSSLRWR